MTDLPEKRKKLMFVAGITAIAIGLGTLSVMGAGKIKRAVHRSKLMKTSTVIQIPDIDIKAPVLEGTEQSVLSEGAGHFKGTGDIGKGNYCVAGHSSTIYKEYFNNLKKAEKGMKIYLFRPDKTGATYTVTDSFIVNPDETWILDDFGDCRITIVTCTDDGSQRLVVTGTLNE